MTRLPVMVDIDGCLLAPALDSHFYDGTRDDEMEARQQIQEDFVAHLWRLVDLGATLHAWTGRIKATEAVTRRQLAPTGLPLRYHFQEDWGGYDALRQHKERVARNLGAVLAIGDTSSDCEAAIAADVPFLWIEDTQQPDPFGHLFCVTCGCTVLRACNPPCAWASPMTCTACLEVLA